MSNIDSLNSEVTDRYLLTSPFLHLRGLVELRLTALEHSHLIASWEVMGECLSVEQGFNGIVESYVQLELLLLDIGLRQSVNLTNGYIAFYGNIEAIALKCLHLLAAARAYEDQTPRRIRKINVSLRRGGFDVPGFDFRTAAAAEYDDRLGYRLMSELRPFVQHFEDAVQSLGFDQRRHEISYGNQWEIATRPSLSRKALLNNDYEKSAKLSRVLKEVTPADADHPDRIELLPHLRDHVEGLGSIQDKWREAYASSCERCGTLIGDALSTFRKLEASLAPETFRESADRIAEVVDTASSAALTLHDHVNEYRVHLARKNASISSLTHHAVSNRFPPLGRVRNPNGRAAKPPRKTPAQ